jgi:hypothetical protein
VAIIVRVPDGEEGEGSDEVVAEGSPRKIKKLEAEPTSPKRTPQQMMTPSPKHSG